MSTTARLLTAVFAASVLTVVSAPFASADTTATDPKGIGWDVVPAHATVSVSVAGASDSGIGWD
ncbi:hypothetical protein [Streptomyces erythrochromogenes]|uniref:hypothetical protein n=1 Tax=Streptomyces erythrochromogenes TaxID=285574 RepID=UPI003863ED1D|nr:hypothetical protein OG489_13965 [Streptomyces erythrochromogenes]